MNWLVIPLANYLDWDKVLIASRLVTAFATLATTCVLIWFSYFIMQRNLLLSMLVGLIYLSGELLLRHGWLAYSDPLFALFIFTSIAASWTALNSNKQVYFIISMFALIFAFLSKALTCYVFYGISIGVLHYKHPNRRLLLKPYFLMSSSIAFAFPVAWSLLLNYMSTTPDVARENTIISDILNKLPLTNSLSIDFKSYLWSLVVYPLDTLLRLLPISGLVVFYYFKTKMHTKQLSAFSNTQSILLLIILLNSIPYWLAIEKNTRYLLPLYPFIALLFGSYIYSLGTRIINLSIGFLILGLTIKYSLLFFPESYSCHRGDFKSAATSILNETKDAPLFGLELTAKALTLMAHINTAQLPNAPLKRADICAAVELLPKGYVISSKHLPNTQIVKQYQFGNDIFYLLSWER
jgi:hypothetical protein